MKTITTTKAEQVAGWLRALIEEQRFSEGRLPSEPRLAEQLGVSRGTLRQAIEQLVRGGLLIRKHGSGTYINENVLGIQTRLEEVWDFEEMIRTSGYSPGVKHHWLKLCEPDRKAAEALQLSAGEEALITANVFLADGVAVIYCVDYLPAGLVKHAYQPEELHGPVYRFLEHRCGQRVDYNITEVRAVTADYDLCPLLACDPGTPLHLFIETGFNSSDQPIIYSEEYYLPEYFSFKVVRKMTALR